MVCDFKMAHLLDVTPSSVVSNMSRGTVTRWSAPEIVREETGATKESDVYAFAMTMLEAITMTRPYDDLNRFQVQELVIEGNLRPSRPLSNRDVDRWLSDDLWVYMAECWSERPSSRPTTDNVVETLSRLSQTKRKCRCGVSHTIDLTPIPLHLFQ